MPPTATPEIAATDPLVVAIVSVSLTLVVGVVVGVISAYLTQRGEHAKWMRERRYDAYIAFMIDMDLLMTLADTTISASNAETVKTRIDAYTERAAAAFEAVSLLGPRSVNAAGQRWVWAIADYLKTKDDHDNEELKSARWQFLIAAGEQLRSKNVGAAPLSRPAAGQREVRS